MTPDQMCAQTSQDSARPDLRTLFKDHGLRCTRQREQIYTALAATKSHPTAEELHFVVRETDGGLSLATIYNTLEAFTDRGLCRRIPSPNGSGPSRFDADLEHHAHILLDDGRVIDLPHDLGEKIDKEIPAKILAEIESRLGIQIESVNLQISGRSIDNA